MSSTNRPATLGRLEKAVLSLFTKPANVTELRRVNPQFTLVTLAGEALCGVPWVPGQKLQIPLRGLTQRTFTPLAWDATAGVTRLLVYVHGDGPVAEWERSLEVGMPCSIFGPRASLDLSALARPALLFGDETSFGLAHALRFTPRGGAGVELLFEVTSLGLAEQALEAVGVSGAQLVERQAGDAHVGVLEDAVASAVRANALRGAVLSGKARLVQKLNKQLRAFGLSRGGVRTKAYWAPGKKGLD